MANQRLTPPSDRQFLSSLSPCIVCLTCVVFSVGATANRRSHAQILPIKPSAEADDPLDSGGPSQAASGNSLSECEDLPAWERQFFRTLETIEGAIAAAEQTVAKAERESTNPLVHQDARRKAEDDRRTAIGGLHLAVHFRLADIKAEDRLNRQKQEFTLTLQSPTFPARSYYSQVTVVISPQQARRLKIASIVRAEGQLHEKDHRAVDVIHFLRSVASPPLAGEQQTASEHLRSSYNSNRERTIRREARYTISQAHYTLDFHIDNIRVASGKLWEEYQQFLPRFQKHLRTYQSSPQQTADTAGDAASDEPSAGSHGNPNLSSPNTP